MDITNINLGTCPLQYLSIGYVGETGARPVSFDFSAWATEYGSGVLQLLLQRPGDADPYPVVLDIDGTTATWTPDATATEKTGQGQAQLVYTVGGVIVKNAIFRVLIAPSLGAPGDPPEPYEDWLQRLLTIAAEAQQSAIDAAGSAEAAGTSAGAAAGSAGAAAQSALDAEAAKSGAETAEQTARQAAALARAKAAEAAEAGQIAGENADYAQQQRIMAEADAVDAHDSAESAAQSAEDAQAASSAAQTAASAAAASASAAAGSAADAASAVTDVETKGAEQITAINQAGTTQIAAVDAAGAAQVQAIEDKGEEVIASIPSDYTELADDVSDLKSALSDNTVIVGAVIQNEENIPIPFKVVSTGYVSSTGGNGASTNAGRTNYIDVSSFTKIKYKRTNVIGGSNWNAAFYYADYSVAAVKRYPYNAEAYSYEATLFETTIPEGAKYARFTTLYDTETYGNFELYAVNGILAELERIDTEIAGLDFIKSETKIGKNLYNPEAATTGKYISKNDGTLSGSASYDTSDFIPVKAGNPIIVSRLRSFLAYDAEKVPLTDTYVTRTKTNYVFTPMVDGFVRASLFVTYASSNMIAYGSTIPEYEPYKETVVVEEGIHISDTMTEDVEAIVSATKGSDKKLTVVVDNDSYTLLSQYSADTKLKRTLSYGKRNNRTFEFEYAYIVDSNGAQTQIKESTDDITPLRLGANGSSRTVGANHGWGMIRVAVGDLTTADAGSVWTDGTNEYILAMVDDTYAYFVLPATMTDDSYTYNTAVPTANLIHVNGATHTGEVSIDGLEGGNLYPSVNNRKHKIYADGIEITEDGTYYCDKFIVWEQYDIMDYVDIGEYLKAHIGTDLLAADEIAGCVRQTIQYTFGETDCVIAHGTEALKNIYYVDCGFLQAIPSTFTGKNFYRYGNGVNSNSPLYSANLLNQTSDSSGVEITPSKLADANVPINRSVDLVKESNGDLAWGFTTGFIPDVSFGANAYRKDLTSFWSLRSNTRKSYPCTFRYRHATAGFYADILGYRNYLRPGLNITNETQIEVGNALYVIVDAHTQQTNRSVKVPEKYIGKSITVLEPVNFALSSDIVGANGVVFSTTAAYGCAVLKIA